MALSAASFSDPLMRDDLKAYYDKMKAEAVAGLRARPETPAGPVKMRMPHGREAAHDFVYEGWQANMDKISAFLVGLQEVDTPDVAAVPDVTAYDFSDMTRQDIRDAGMALFRAGKITLDELFRFEHPDGKLRIGEDAGAVVYNPFEKIDFIGWLTQAMRDMEATGEANRADSGYSVFAGLVEKLEGWRKG